MQKIFFWIMKINNYQGDLTDVSAKKEALVLAVTFTTSTELVISYTTNFNSCRADPNDTCSKPYSLTQMSYDLVTISIH